MLVFKLKTELHMDLQFYPTPLELAAKAWGKFKNRNFSRVLEPSAGVGDLLKAMPYFGSSNRHTKIDVCEIDFNKHPVLRSLEGVSVVGHDFMEFGGGAIYSHVIANPPFAYGVSHTLKMWDCLYDGELVVILNAESIKNPYSKERQLLVSLIERYGDVEFLESEFTTDETLRKTKVEVALVHLTKVSDVQQFVVASVLGTLDREDSGAISKGVSEGYDKPQELALPSNFIENLVIVFQSAVKAMREAVLCEVRASYYAGLLGGTMSEVLSGKAVKPINAAGWVRATFESRYIALKDAAWANVLRSSQVTSKLSSSAQHRMESEFNTIKELAFSVTNVEGFLRGLIENQSKIQMDMACDVFDLIGRYHTDNLVFYKGWRSNDNQRTCGMRIKTTRFVIPGNQSYSINSGLRWEDRKRLSDFDKVFAMLDGKDTPAISLVEVFANSFRELYSGERLSSSYFDVRYYPGAGTIHFFARDKGLIEKFNVLVGQYRKWLPPSDTKVSTSFWDQFKNAEKHDKDVRAVIASNSKGKGYYYGHSPLANLFSRDTGGEAALEIEEAVTSVLAAKGLPTDYCIEATRQVFRLSNGGVHKVPPAVGH